jgi:hypothetical protein
VTLYHYFFSWFGGTSVTIPDGAFARAERELWATGDPDTNSDLISIRLDVDTSDGGTVDFLEMGNPRSRPCPRRPGRHLLRVRPEL